MDSQGGEPLMMHTAKLTEFNCVAAVRSISFHAGTAITSNDQPNQAIVYTPTTTQFPFMEEGAYKGWVGGDTGAITINWDKGRRRSSHAGVEFGSCARLEYGGYSEGNTVILGNAHTEIVTYQGEYNGTAGI